MGRLGVVIIGLNGAVASTLVAGVALMKKGLVPRRAMLTEPDDTFRADKLTDILEFAKLEDLVFGGWDLNDESIYEAALRHGVFRKDQLEPVREELTALRPWPAVFSKDYAQNLEGRYIVATEGGHLGQVEEIKRNMASFKEKEGLRRVVLVNLASTEKWMERGPAHQTIDAFEKALASNDPCISPTMRYMYAANSLGIPHANFAPSLANIPALEKQAEKNGVPYAGMDGKTGQTLVKTAMASMLRLRRLWVDGWYSVNFLGNNDGLVLDDPKSNETKVRSKASVLDSVVGHKVDNHQVHIHYYKPRGDAKEAWDNIDVQGFCGEPMQMKINFLCKDSILAAPLCIDMVRILDVAQDNGEKGIQRQMSMYFKSPYVTDGEAPVHDLFQQERMLYDWARGVANKKSASQARPAANGPSAANGGAAHLRAAQMRRED
jgi:myo-inositol-1-phosphate synthase